jgi:hypothetical protein
MNDQGLAASSLHPGAKTVDAFKLDWSTFKLVYALSPFSLIPRVLQKIREDEAEAVLIDPTWTSQA